MASRKEPDWDGALEQVMGIFSGDIIDKAADRQQRAENNEAIDKIKQKIETTKIKDTTYKQEQSELIERRKELMLERDRLNERLKELALDKEKTSARLKVLRAQLKEVKERASGKGAYKWRLLDVDREGNRGLFITEDVVAIRPYHQSNRRVAWEKCSLRLWLNNEFYNELPIYIKSRVIETMNRNSDFPYFGSFTDRETLDKVFLLSVDEAQRLFSDNEDRLATYNNRVREWWLRTSSERERIAGTVNDKGMVQDYNGVYMESEYTGVRPAIWATRRCPGPRLKRCPGQAPKVSLKATPSVIRDEFSTAGRLKFTAVGYNTDRGRLWLSGISKFRKALVPAMENFLIMRVIWIPAIPLPYLKRMAPE